MINRDMKFFLFENQFAAFKAENCFPEEKQ
jgi:hypothetical protein